jgi:hypothetical protein
MTHKSKSKPKVSDAKYDVKDVKDTSCAKKGSAKPMTKNFINVEAAIKKDKEVKEKDVFDFKKSKAVKR